MWLRWTHQEELGHTQRDQGCNRPIHVTISSPWKWRFHLKIDVFVDESQSNIDPDHVYIKESKDIEIIQSINHWFIIQIGIVKSF